MDGAFAVWQAACGRHRQKPGICIIAPLMVGAGAMSSLLHRIQHGPQEPQRAEALEVVIFIHLFPDPLFFLFRSLIFLLSFGSVPWAYQCRHKKPRIYKSYTRYTQKITIYFFIDKSGRREGWGGGGKKQKQRDRRQILFLRHHRPWAPSLEAALIKREITMPKNLPKLKLKTPKMASAKNKQIKPLDIEQKHWGTQTPGSSQ